MARTNDDFVKNPHHYTSGGIEPIQYIRSRGMNYLEGNVIKYVSRYRLKGGVQDLLKARQYLDWLIDETTPAQPKGPFGTLVAAAVSPTRTVCSANGCRNEAMEGRFNCDWHKQP